MAGDNLQKDSHLLSREDLPQVSWTDADTQRFMEECIATPRPMSGPEVAWLEDEQQKPTITTQ